MLNYSILSSKPTIVKNGEEFIDLQAKVYTPPKSFSGKVIVVSRHYIARPDLISQAFYGTDEYADVICKVNGLSNPLELNEDDTIVVPPVEYCLNYIQKASSDSSDIINPDKEQLDKEQNFRKTKTERRSPNEQLSNEFNYVIDKSSGLIFY